MENFFGEVSDLSRKGDFSPKEESIVRDVFIFNLRNEEFRKQLCMETLAQVDALQFSKVSGRGEMIYKRVSGGLSKLMRNKLSPGRQKTGGGQQSGYIKREPVNDVKGYVKDKCNNCENCLKPNNRENCPARIVFCNNCSGFGHFAKHCRKKIK